MQRGTRSGVAEVQSIVQSSALPKVNLSAPLLSSHIVRFAESRKLSILDAVKAIRDDAAAIGFREYVWENRKCLDPVFAQDHLNYKALRERLADIGKRIARSNSATGVFRDSHPIRIKTSNIPYLGYVLGIIGVRTITIPLSSSRRPPLYEVFIARWFK